jgi:hypothetical protein
MYSGFVRSWPIERIATGTGLQIRQIGEHVRLAAKFIGNHWRLTGNRGDHRNANTASPHGFDSERKSPSPEKSTMSSTRSASSIASIVSSMSMLPLDLPVAVRADKFLGRLGNHGEAVVIEPIEQRAN